MTILGTHICAHNALTVQGCCVYCCHHNRKRSTSQFIQYPVDDLAAFECLKLEAQSSYKIEDPLQQLIMVMPFQCAVTDLFIVYRARPFFTSKTYTPHSEKVKVVKSEKVQLDRLTSQSPAVSIAPDVPKNICSFVELACQSQLFNTAKTR